MTLTTERSAPPAVDEDRVLRFAGSFVTDLAGAATTAMVVVGDRLGIYRAMAAAGPVTARDLAASTGLHERLLTEWLGNQTVSGYVTYDPDTDRYELPLEHAAVLSVEGSPALVVGAAEVVAAQFATLERLEQAFRGDGAIDYGEHPRSLYTGIERFFATAYSHELAVSWFPAVEGLVAKLEAGARVADVGSGHGVSTLLMAERWPASTFVGFDFHDPSVQVARAKAVEAGSPANASFRVASAEDIGPGPFDVVVFLDALHDLGDPPAALRRAHQVLDEGGIVVAVEPWSLDRLEDGIGNPHVRIDYAVSTSLCTPGSLAQPGAYGLGTQGGPARRIQLLADAGFRDPRLVLDTGQSLVLAARR